MCTHHTTTRLPRVTVAHCPSCEHDAVFTYGGEQHWPQRIAEAAGLPPVTYLWHCEHCQSTISSTSQSALAD